MGKALRSAILVLCNTNVLGFSHILEEVLDCALVRPEAQIADKQGGGLASCVLSHFWLVASRRLRAEFDLDLPSIQLGLVGGSKCRLGLFVSFELDEALALVVDKLALVQRTVL